MPKASSGRGDQEYQDEDTNNYTAINQLLQDEQISGLAEGYEMREGSEEEPEEDVEEISDGQDDEQELIAQQLYRQHKQQQLRLNNESNQKENEYLNVQLDGTEEAVNDENQNNMNQEPIDQAN